jgi:hypothetical protein
MYENLLFIINIMTFLTLDSIDIENIDDCKVIRIY